MGSISNILSGMFITPPSQAGAGSNNQFASQISGGSDSSYGDAFMLSLSQAANGDGTDTDTTLGAGYESSPQGSVFVAAGISGENNASSAYEKMLSLLGTPENNDNTIGDNANDSSGNAGTTSETPLQLLSSQLAMAKPPVIPTPAHIEAANLASMAQNTAQLYNQMEQTYGPDSDFTVFASMTMTPGETSETIGFSTPA